MNYPITRRSFIKLSGISALSCLYDKPFLAEASEGKWVKNYCPFCSQGCGMELSVKEGKIVAVRGMREDSETEGALCAWGKSLPQIIYNPRRVTQPLKRVGKKGEGRFEKISWSDALNLIREKFSRIITENGAESIAGYLGGAISLESFWLMPRLLSALGSPNFFSGVDDDSLCWAYGGYYTTGAFPVLSLENIKKSKCVILWGHNPATSYPPAILEKIFSQKKFKLIVIDPRCFPLAKGADEWVPVRPGTDGALAWSIAQVMIRDNLIDKDFIQKWTEGYEAFREIALRGEYLPKKVALICSIKEEQIETIAHLFAQNHPAFIWGGSGVSQHSNGLQTSRAIHCLSALTGNVNRPGTNYYYHFSDPFRGFPALEDKFLGRGDKNKKLALLSSGLSDSTQLWNFIISEGKDVYWKDNIDRRAVTEKKLPYSSTPVYSKGYQGPAYPIKALIVQGGNPLINLPNQTKGKIALRKLDFMLVIDQFIHATAQYADLILPVARNPEVDHLIGNQYPVPRPNLSFCQQVIDPPENCYSDEQIFRLLGKIFGFHKEFEFTSEGFANLILSSSSSPRTRKLSIEKIKNFPLKSLFTFFPDKAFPYPGRENFPTASGKIMLNCDILESYGFNPYPEWSPPAESPERTPEYFKKYPLILAMGKLELKDTVSDYPEEMLEEPWIEINPALAKKLGLKDGDLAWVESKVGREIFPVRIKKEVKEGVVWCAAFHKGIISSFYPPKLANRFSLSNLIDEDHSDPICGCPRDQEMLVKVYKV